jgi:hypothetical protein
MLPAMINGRLVSLIAFAIALACSGCGDSHDRHSYDVGRGVSEEAQRIAEKAGLTDIAASCREALRARFASELMFRDEPSSIDMASAVAGCVDALK